MNSSKLIQKERRKNEIREHTPKTTKKKE